MLVERYNPKYTRNMKVAENHEYQLDKHNDDFYKARKKPYANPQFSNANEFISLHEYFQLRKNALTQDDLRRIETDTRALLSKHYFVQEEDGRFKLNCDNKGLLPRQKIMDNL
jgi:hypothetical protein